MLIGHQKQKKYFKNVLNNRGISHAYFFTGPERIGKKSFALELFRQINGREPSGDPDFISAQPDISEGGSKIYIEDVRKVKSFFQLKPYAGPYKMALIDDAHCLTTEAVNALLKILEEPPVFSTLILVSSLPKMIPGTILSRCEQIRFSPAGAEVTEEYLLGKKIKKEDKEFLIKLAGGRIGLINSLLEGGLPEAKKAVDDLRRLFKSDVSEKFSYAKKMHESDSYKPAIEYWLNWVAAHVAGSPKNENIVRELLFLNSLISQPQYNHRLALENFLLGL